MPLFALKALQLSACWRIEKENHQASACALVLRSAGSVCVQGGGQWCSNVQLLRSGYLDFYFYCTKGKVQSASRAQRNCVKVLTQHLDRARSSAGNEGNDEPQPPFPPVESAAPED